MFWLENRSLEEWGQAREKRRWQNWNDAKWQPPAFRHANNWWRCQNGSNLAFRERLVCLIANQAAGWPEYVMQSAMEIQFCVLFIANSLQQMEKVCFCWSPAIALRFFSSKLVQSSRRVIFANFLGMSRQLCRQVFAMREESSVTFVKASGKLTQGRRRKSRNFICMPCKSTDLGSIVETNFASLLLSILVVAAGMSVAIPKIRDVSNKQ